MNPDEYDFMRHVPKVEPSNVALDLIRGLEDRSYSRFRKSKASHGVFAEDELVRKRAYDELHCEMPGQPRSTFLMVFSPDGTKVASTHGNHNIYVTDIKSGKNIRTLVGHPRTPWCIAFHPTSNQILASGCLGGEVRIWDLSGGSEVWHAENPSVIASIAFHPNDRILVIATYNELYFWDWSIAAPFVQVATANPKEKIRYVAFDRLGHKLITGIANSPQTRWERTRAPVRTQARPMTERFEQASSSPFLRVSSRNVATEMRRAELPTTNEERTRETVSFILERERRIASSYRNLVSEYEQLVQRYLKVYKPPTMIDRGTDPMEQNSSSTSSTQAPEATTRAASTSSSMVANTSAGSISDVSTCSPSTSSDLQPSTSSLVMPSRILAMSKQTSEANNSTQTTESRKHKSSDISSEKVQMNKRSKNDESPCSTASTSSLSSLSSPSSTASSSHAETATQTLSSRRVLFINDRSEPSTSSGFSAAFNQKGKSGVRIMCPKLSKRKVRANALPAENSTVSSASTSTGTTSINAPQPSTSRNNTEELFRNFRPIAEEVRNRCLPIIKSLPACDRPKLLRSFVSYKRMKLKQMSSVVKKVNRRPILATSSDSTSSEDEDTSERSRLPMDLRNNRNPDNPSANGSSNLVPSTSTGTNQASSLTSGVGASSNPSLNFIPGASSGTNQLLNCTPSTSSLQSVAGNGMSGVRNFVMELEQLLMTVLLSEMESSNSDQPNTNTNEPNCPTPSTSSAAIQSTSQNDGILRSSPVSMNLLLAQRGLIRPSAVNGNSVFRRALQMYETESTETRSDDLNQGRTQTSSYNRTLPRRRLYRVSAFMPTRVNYNRNSMRHRRGSSQRTGSRFSSNVTYSLDELINYSARPDAEDNLPEDSQPPVLSSPPLTPPDNINLNTSYSNIIQDLESSLNDVRSIRAGTRSNETSDMLSSFSESLENIMNQSDTILRNLGGNFMPTLPSFTPPTNNDPRVESVNDSNFFVRNLQEPSTSGAGADGRSVIETDHSYPRSGGEHLTPLMTSLHLTISYIQRQARLLRQQVESIERIDRTMFEVEQLQLIRLLIMEFLRYIRSLAGESRSTGLSSVRQMMAGTRISDSSPYDTQTEENSQSTTTNSNAPSTSTASTSTAGETSQPRHRSSGRKTYPPSRLFRSQRHHRRGLFINFFPRRYSGRPGSKTNGPCRTAASRQSQDSNALRHSNNNYSLINSSTLNLMARRLEHLLTEQTRLITRSQEGSSSQSNRSYTTIDVGERILSIRLHDCVLRMNRIMGNTLENSRFRNSRSDTIVVTIDGESRFGARHFLSLIVDGMSRHVEDLGGANLSQNIRTQIHSVLAMALLLSDLLLLQLVDSIPPPAGMNLDVERESLTSRIDQMCGQMLQNRFSGHSHQLTRSLQHMRVTMRHAYRAIGQTYNARRNAMLPNRQDSNRRQLLNRYLRNINRRRQPQNQSNETNSVTGWSSLRDLILRYSDNTAQDDDDSLSNAEPPRPRFEAGSSNNSDDNDEESEWYVGNNSRNTTNLYRTNNVNLVAPNNNNDSNSSSGTNTNNSEEPTRRSWNVPSVQVNDVPISEQPSMFQHRILTHRQRLAERVSELRSFPPQMSLLRPRFLHPLYASVNPFDADLEDQQREPNYDCDMMISTVTPNYRIQVWDISSGKIPVINNPLKNIIVSECKIHNDASVDIAKDGTILVTLLPSSGYLNITNKLGVYSLKWDTLGQCLYTTSFEQNAVSVSLSPMSRHLIVGLASRRVSMVPSERWILARIFVIDQNNVARDRLPCLREIGQDRDSRATSYKSVNCIRWLPTSGQGVIYATNTGQLVILS